MKKNLSSMTLSEAEAYRQGYEDGLADAKPGSTKMRRRAGIYPECDSSDPDKRCKDCRCWKIFREYTM